MPSPTTAERWIGAHEIATRSAAYVGGHAKAAAPEDESRHARKEADLERLSTASTVPRAGTDLTVPAFGVIIQARSDGENPRILRQGLLDATPTDIRLEDLGGSRHQSAARACIRLKGAVAYVAPQDGGLTTVRWDEKQNALVVRRDLELLL
ncbi:MAG TPA: hypothetical protein VGC79_24590 [Polyangiaceae bacterium]